MGLDFDQMSVGREENIFTVESSCQLLPAISRPQRDGQGSLGNSQETWY